MDLVADFRAFNRFYTRRIGLLQQSLPGGDLSLPMARVLYEIATAVTPPTAADLGRLLGMDKAHLSRVAARLKAQGLVEGRERAGRRIALSPTALGRATFESLDRASAREIGGLVANAPPERRVELARAFADIRAALGGGEGEVTLRGLKPGDIGWIAHRQGLLYHQEYGWDASFEALVARILADFADSFDPAREAAFVADRSGAVLGSAFLVKGDELGTAKLRLLYVEPHARGLGLGARLVDAVIARAREAGYSALTLWTNDILTAARRIYISRGFRFVDEAPHRSFGADLVGQNWRLDLSAVQES